MSLSTDADLYDGPASGGYTSSVSTIARNVASSSISDSSSSVSASTHDDEGPVGRSQGIRALFILNPSIPEAPNIRTKSVYVAALSIPHKVY